MEGYMFHDPSKTKEKTKTTTYKLKNVFEKTKTPNKVIAKVKKPIS